MSDVKKQLEEILGRIDPNQFFYHLKRPLGTKHDPNSERGTIGGDSVWSGTVAQQWKQQFHSGSTSTKWFSNVGSYDVAFRFFVDGYQPFEHTQYSETAFCFSLENLPPGLKMKSENVILIALFPGHRSGDTSRDKYKQVDLFGNLMKPIVDLLIDLFFGVPMNIGPANLDPKLGPMHVQGVRTVRALLLLSCCDTPASRYCRGRGAASLVSAVLSPCICY